jgi:hypothetical protein
MAARYIFNTQGNYVAFIEDNHLFSPERDWIGFVVNGNEVYQRDGKFLGYLLKDDRIAKKRNERRPRMAPPLRPSRPLRPLRPLRRLRMPRLPYPYEDVFAAGLVISPEASTLYAGKDFEFLLGAKIYAADDQYLGIVSRSKYESESVSNQFGSYGSRYATSSIFNQYSAYGGRYGGYSPFNTYCSNPPRLVKESRIIGYLTVNPYVSNRIDADELIAWLELDS